MSQDGPTEKTFILAPVGRDAELAAAIVEAAQVPAEVCTSLHELVERAGRGAGLLLIADEAIITADLRPLTQLLAKQAAWSDLPIILMTKQGGGPERNPAAGRLAELLGNVTFIERPFHPTTLASLVRTALRSRRRQYQAGFTLAELGRRQAELTKLAETLEQRVAERTGQWQKSEAALRQIQKMEVMGQLTGGVAHDFNNLLMAVMGNLDLLRKRHGSDPRSARLIEGALQGAERGAALTRRMLAFARQQDLKTEPVELKALIGGMADLLTRSVGPQFDLQLLLRDGLPLAEVDTNQIELAILNLVLNARDAMPNAGTITITADLPDIIPGSLAPGTYLRVSVADTGAGMTPQTLARAIEPFFTTKDVGKGTGLGLSMVHGLAVQHGGLFELSSEVGIGTTATIWLPASVKRQQEHATPPEPALAENMRATILVVDDDTLISMATVDMLQDLGHSVIEANSGKQALEVLESGAQVDIMITDHAMPGMTGIELAEKARQKIRDLPILLATGYADLGPGEHMDLPRLSKPYLQEALKNEVDKLLTKRML